MYANKIKELPATIGSIKSLRVLNLFNNQLRKLPVEIGTLASLEEVSTIADMPSSYVDITDTT